MGVSYLLAGLLYGVSVTGMGQQVHAGTEAVSVTVEKLRAGEYVWEPLAAPTGPLLLVVSLPRQRAMLFRNGVPIAATTISSGRPGYETPTGIFTVLQKRKEHYSSTYDNAPMPYMHRLTWRGVALHAGNLPGRPASHGCVRLPLGFAKALFGASHVGKTVVVSNARATPKVAPARDLLGQGERVASATVSWRPQASPSGPVSIIVSAADRRALVLRNGIEIGRSPVSIDGPVKGSWLYMLRQDKSEEGQWVKVDMSVAGDPQSPVPPTEWTRFHAPEQFRRNVASILRPGTTIIVTEDTLEASRPGLPTRVLEDDASPAG